MASNWPYHSLMIGWSKFRLGLPFVMMHYGLMWLVGIPNSFRCQQQSPYKCLSLGMCKGTMKESIKPPAEAYSLDSRWQTMKSEWKWSHYFFSLIYNLKIWYGEKLSQVNMDYSYLFINQFWQNYQILPLFKDHPVWCQWASNCLVLPAMGLVRLNINWGKSTTAAQTW